MQTKSPPPASSSRSPRDRPLSSALTELDLSESYRILHSSRNQHFLFPNAK